METPRSATKVRFTTHSIERMLERRPDIAPADMLPLDRKNECKRWMHDVVVEAVENHSMTRKPPKWYSMIGKIPKGVEIRYIRVRDPESVLVVKGITGGWLVLTFVAPSRGMWEPPSRRRKRPLPAR